MKPLLLLILFFGPIISSYSQSISINELTPIPASGGINLHVVVTTYNGAGYIGSTYTVEGSVINVSVCYWFNETLPVYQMTNDVLLEVPNDTNYTINVTIVHSSSDTECDYYNVAQTQTTNYLSTADFGDGSESLKNKVTVYPNPSKDYLFVSCDKFQIDTPLEVRVTDIRGMKIIETNAISDGNAFKVDVSALQTGMYFVETTNQQRKTFRAKFIKQ